jgi:hypothetical protein
VAWVIYDMVEYLFWIIVKWAVRFQCVAILDVLLISAVLVSFALDLHSAYGAVLKACQFFRL